MTPQEVLTAAKSGNPQAIAALINRHLKPQGITAKAKLAADCLHVMVEGVTVPEQRAIVPYIIKGVRGLEMQGVSSLAIYGKVAGEDVPAWTERVELQKAEANTTTKPLTTLASPSQLNTEAKNRPTEVRDKKQPSKFESIVGIFGIAVFIVLGLHRCGYPHNCEEARESFSDAKRNSDSLYKKAEDVTQGHVSDSSLFAASQESDKAERKMLDKCYPK